MAEIMISNKMSTIYSLKGYSESTIDTDVVVGVYTNSDIEVEVAVRGTGISDIPVLLNVVYSGSSEIEVDVQPIILSEIEVEVEVNPVNKMSVIYEIAEPTTIIYEATTLKDAFISSNQPYDVINFGGNNSMKVGNDSYGNNTAFIAFDTSEVPSSKVIKNVTMRVYYTTYLNADLQLNKVNSVWSEFSLTYQNNKTNITPMVTKYVINESERYIDFEITDQFQEWYNGLPNNGIAITSQDNITLFRAKETDLPPRLLVEYYSDDIYSIGTSKVLIDVLVAVEKESTINVDVDVVSQFSNSEILVDVLAHQKEDIIISEIETDVYVPEYEANSVIEVDITVVINDSALIDVEVEVPILDDKSSIDIEVDVITNGYSEVNVEIEVEDKGTLYNYSELNVEVEVPTYLNMSEIEVDVFVIIIENSKIDVEFEISDGLLKDQYSEILTSLEVIEQGTYSQFDVEIGVYNNQYSEIEVDVQITEYESSSVIEVDVFVNIKEADSSIDIFLAVVEYGDSAIDVDVSARVLDISDIFVDVAVITGGKKNIYCYKL